MIIIWDKFAKMTVICRADISLFKYTKYLLTVEYVLPRLLNTILNSTNLRLSNLKPLEETHRSVFFRAFAIQKKAQSVDWASTFSIL